MNKRQFVQHRKPFWGRFSHLLNRASGSALLKLDQREIREFSRLLRELSNDLATVRSRDWGEDLETYLNHLVGRGHNSFYSAPPGNMARVYRYLTVDFPRLCRANAGYFLTAVILFFVSGGITWTVVQNDLSMASRIIPNEQLEQIDQMYEERRDEADGAAADDEGGDLSSNEDADSRDADSDNPIEDSFGEQRVAMAGFYIEHNVGIALHCFAIGVFWGVGTVYTLLFNGIAIGAIAGYVVGQGNSERFLSFVVSHGAFELTAIAIAGAAGLMLGNALLHPGQRSRREALRVRALDAVQVVGGAAAMLVVAAFIEAFWSPAPIPSVLKYVVATCLWLAVFSYLAFSGRGR